MTNENNVIIKEITLNRSSGYADRFLSQNIRINMLRRFESGDFDIYAPDKKGGIILCSDYDGFSPTGQKTALIFKLRKLAERTCDSPKYFRNYYDGEHNREDFLFNYKSICCEFKGITVDELVKYSTEICKEFSPIALICADYSSDKIFFVFSK